MEKTKIDWADSTWNPVTGCLHQCKYCYARGIANRFGLHLTSDSPLKRHELDEPNPKSPYPYDFEPTFHRYRLGEYANKRGRTIFVCSMADLFGAWVPDEWIVEVFKACAAAPQHRYIFLTKNPKRFSDMRLVNKLHITDNMWFGFTATKQEELEKLALSAIMLPKNTFISIEPLHGPMKLNSIRPHNADGVLDFTRGKQYWITDSEGKRLQWVIVGAESGKRKDKVIPEKEWVNAIVKQCKPAGIPVFMKSSLTEIMGTDFCQEYPWR